MVQAIGVGIVAHDLPRIVDAIGGGALERRRACVGIVDSGVLPVHQQESVAHAVGVSIYTHGLPTVVDAFSSSTTLRRRCIGVIDGGVLAILQYESVIHPVGVDV